MLCALSSLNQSTKMLIFSLRVGKHWFCIFVIPSLLHESSISCNAPRNFYPSQSKDKILIKSKMKMYFLSEFSSLINVKRNVLSFETGSCFFLSLINEDQNCTLFFHFWKRTIRMTSNDILFRDTWLPFLGQVCEGPTDNQWPNLSKEQCTMFTDLSSQVTLGRVLSSQTILYRSPLRVRKSGELQSLPISL